MRNGAARPVILAVMLGLTGLLSAVLAAQAVYAARRHRAVAEQVLHDYASLGAEGVAQRLRTALGQRFSGALLAAAALRSDQKLTSAAIRAALPGVAREAVTDSTTFIRVTRSDSLAPILIAATSDLPSYAYFGLRWVDRVTGRALMVFQPFRDTWTSVIAFTIPERDVRALIATIIASMPVLPASLAHGTAADSGTGVRVSSAHGELASVRFDSLTPFRASVVLGQPHGDLSIDVDLAERIAPSLVVGGLPRSRVPLLFMLLLMSVGLTVAAGDQIRREVALSRLREDFVSSVSHELRTPLAQIRMFAETLRLGRVRTQAEGDRSLVIIENEARRMEHLVENLLHFSRAERSALQISATSTNLSSLMHDITGEFAPLAERTESHLALHADPGITANVDPSALRQAMLNLLDNAVKYGRRGQTINVRLSASRGIARIEVDDEGSGIAVAERDAIFDRFTRGESARRSGVAGTGVGLAIVRDVAQLHGGTARAESAPEGGARMVIEIPAATVTP